MPGLLDQNHRAHERPRVVPLDVGPFRVVVHEPPQPSHSPAYGPVCGIRACQPSSTTFDGVILIVGNLAAV